MFQISRESLKKSEYSKPDACVKGRFNGEARFCGFSIYHRANSGRNPYLFILSGGSVEEPIILQYVAAGIRNGEKVVCLMDSLTKEAILDVRTEQVKTNGYDPERG